MGELKYSMYKIAGLELIPVLHLRELKAGDRITVGGRVRLVTADPSFSESTGHWSLCAEDVPIEGAT